GETEFCVIMDAQRDVPLVRVPLGRGVHHGGQEHKSPYCESSEIRASLRRAVSWTGTPWRVSLRRRAVLGGWHTTRSRYPREGGQGTASQSQCLKRPTP